MNDPDIDAITGWLIDRGLAGEHETELLNGFCEPLLRRRAFAVARRHHHRHPPSDL